MLGIGVLHAEASGDYPNRVRMSGYANGRISPGNASSLITINGIGLSNITASEPRKVKSGSVSISGIGATGINLHRANGGFANIGPLLSRGLEDSDIIEGLAQLPSLQSSGALGAYVPPNAVVGYGNFPVWSAAAKLVNVDFITDGLPQLGAFTSVAIGFGDGNLHGFAYQRFSPLTSIALDDSFTVNLRTTGGLSGNITLSEIKITGKDASSGNIIFDSPKIQGTILTSAVAWGNYKNPKIKINSIAHQSSVGNGDYIIPTIQIKGTIKSSYLLQGNFDLSDQFYIKGWIGKKVSITGNIVFYNIKINGNVKKTNNDDLLTYIRCHECK